MCIQRLTLGQGRPEVLLDLPELISIFDLKDDLITSTIESLGGCACDHPKVAGEEHHFALLAVRLATDQAEVHRWRGNEIAPTEPPARFC